MLLPVIFKVIYMSAAVVVGLSLVGLYQAVRPPKIKTPLSPSDYGWEFEEVKLKTRDGVNLAAWYVPAEAEIDKTIVVLHGYPADKANVLPWAGFLREEFNLLYLDFRYFGESQGAMTTLGIKEKLDLRAAVDYLVDEKKQKSVGVMGFSLGGAVGLVGAVEIGGVDAVVSDSAFANLNLMAESYYGQLGLLKRPLTELTKLWAKLLLGIDAKNGAVDELVRGLDKPVLVIHSTKDNVVGIENAERIQSALEDNERAEFWFRDGGDHGQMSNSEAEEFQARVREFFEKSM